MDCWTANLQRHRAYLDLTSLDLEGSHIPAVRGEYLERKRHKKTNVLNLTDRQGRKGRIP
ncbi:MAG: hypothetical protein ACX93O_04125 [Flagellimonas sp.]